jgi:hypothetical protein
MCEVWERAWLQGLERFFLSDLWEEYVDLKKNRWQKRVSWHGSRL